MTNYILDVDGVMTPYSGGDYRSLYSKFIDNSKYKNESDREMNLLTAKYVANMMINRIDITELDKLKNNITWIYNNFGKIRLLSLNYKIVVIEYINALELAYCFDFGDSYFRDNIESEKGEVWDKIIMKNKNCVYIDDDIDEINALKKINNKHVNFIHLKQWLGVVDYTLFHLVNISPF